MSDEKADRPQMTEEQQAIYERATSGYGDQDENGIDLSLLRANLRLSPTERVEKIRRFAYFCEELCNAGIKSRMASHAGRSDAG